MKKLLVALLLSLFSASAMAECTPVNVRDHGDSLYFVDLDTIHKTDHMVRMWELADHKTEKQFGNINFLSAKMHAEFDCKEEKRRALSAVYFSDHMGSGDVIHRTNYAGQWKPVPQGDLYEAMWEAACGVR